MISPILALLAAAALVAAYLADSRTLAGVGFALAVIGAVVALAVWLLEPASKQAPASEPVGDDEADDEADDATGDAASAEEADGETDESVEEAEPVADEPVDEPAVEPGAAPIDEPVAATPASEQWPEVVDEDDAAADGASVWVITGRKRFHRRDCPLLGQRPAEELSVADARVAGFSPCSACSQ